MTPRQVVRLALAVLVVSSACGARPAVPVVAPATAPPAPTVTAPPSAPTVTPASPTASSPPPPSPPPPACADPLGCHGAPERAGAFDVATVPEASGVAASRRNPGVWWLLNDGDRGEVHWIDPAASTAGTVALAGLAGRGDAEGLAVAPCAAGAADACVFVGDIGDNGGRREGIRVARFAEPDVSAPPEGPVALDVVTLRYPGPPVDAEALLVDDAGVPHVVTKDPAGGRLYAAPGFADGTLVDLGAVAVPAPAEPLASLLVGNVVTGGDSRPGRVLLRTYDHVVEYVAPDPSAPLATFPSWPSHEVPAAFESQSEGVAYSADGAAYATVGEGSGDLWLVRRPDP